MASAPQMSVSQARAFKDAAKLYNVYILVRRTNLMSLRYVGDASCTPKRLDCKAKTADCDYLHESGPKQVAGLVVDPITTGRTAFLSQKKYESALNEWRGSALDRGFADSMLNPAVSTLEGQRALTYIPNGGFYFIDLDPKSVRYGCVKFSINSLLSAGKYIHGDFDLYGIVGADDPARNVAVREERLGQKHSRSPEFFDVQHYVNRHIGVPMVLHGAQESYSSDHSDEGIDIFEPDGGFLAAENVGEITRLYDKVFKGRRLFTKNGPRRIVSGLFMAPL